LSELGLGDEKSQLVESKAKRALREFSDLAERQKAVGKSAQWVQFAAPTPGVVPSGTDGSTQDVLAYENAVAMFTDGGENGQIMVGTIVKSGSAWRLIDLPSVGNDGESVAQSSGNLFAAASPAMTGANGNLNSKTQELVTKLESIDAQLSKIEDPKESAPLHAQRADVIEALAASAADAAERETWIRQLVDTMSIAVQTGAYPDGAERMEKIATSFADGDETLAAYADYAAINSQYVVRQTPDAEFEKVQEWYLDALAGFVDRYPKTPEAAKAWLQLALVKEFDENETEALDYYKKVASGFPGTDEGFKADGAIRRLESVGQKIELEGTTIEGKPFRLSQLGGKPVVIHYWATWCEPCKQDMQLLRRLQAAYARTGLQLVGINVDGTKEQAEAFIAESRLPWTQLFEPGGLEGSSLANRLGVQTLPTILLIDADGKVVRHNIQAPELDAELQKLTKK
jgi:thiol-disulfide isomerase/thioredoxin